MKSISAMVKVRVLQEVRKHMSLTDEEFRQLVINILREHMEVHSSFSAAWVVAEPLESLPIQVTATMVGDQMRHRVVDDFIAAARRLLVNGAEGSSFAEEQRKAL
ncbi:MAG: hypothetical protein GEV05_30455 [Betaproteobacteria bacterium]|nr:hypothetical protein [Betaproteobacteria bacterium]